MPNYVHGIIKIVGTGSKPVRQINANYQRVGLEPAPTLSEIIRQFKTFSTKRINQKRNTLGKKIWQRSFHDYIIRDEHTLNKIRKYITNNPQKRENDHNHPDNINTTIWSKCKNAF